MDDWVLGRLQEFVGRADREKIAPRARGGLVKQVMGDTTSYRMARSLPALGRGLVVTEEGVIPDYGRVRRVFHLANAIVKYYYSPFYVEEKVPGYHSRVAWIGGRQIAFTRDGRFCAFTTDRAPDFIPDELFRDNPHSVVCLTVAGRGIPYTKAGSVNGVDEVTGYATDLLELNVREPVELAERYALFGKYGLKEPDRVGAFEADHLEELEAWMRDIEDRGAPGVILKPSERHHRPLKFSFPTALLASMPAWAAFDSSDDEHPFFERLVQAACAATEMERAADNWDWENIGRALLAPLAAAAKEVESGGRLAEEYSVWLHDDAAAEELLRQLDERSEDVTVERLALKAEGDGWRLQFERRFNCATATLARRLSGASYRS